MMEVVVEVVVVVVMLMRKKVMVMMLMSRSDQPGRSWSLQRSERAAGGPV